MEGRGDAGRAMEDEMEGIVESGITSNPGGKERTPRKSGADPKSFGFHYHQSFLAKEAYDALSKQKHNPDLISTVRTPKG